ncbi:MAG: c-type cytochrome [Longimicrobiales bacterium]
MSKSMRFSALIALLTFGAACGGGEGGAPAAESEQPAAESTAAAPAPAVDMELPDGVTPEMVAQGETIFTGAGICYTCHMTGGVGGPLAPNLTDDEWINIDGSYDAIVQLVTTGVPEPVEHAGLMLPKGGSNISDEEVRAVAAYVWTLSKGS